MRVPKPPNVRPLQQVSPSVYEALLRCKARAAWAAFGDRSTVPQHPKALLGVCLNSVVEDAHNGKMAGLRVEDRQVVAREFFDKHAKALYDESHPLLRAKFTAPERLPYYNLYRERATLEAAAAAERVERSAPSARADEFVPHPRLVAERKLLSRDGLVVGRPDLVDLAAHEVVDYKTGAPHEEMAGALSEAEQRQLRLYVYLALDNDLPVLRAVIARADGQRAAIEVSKEEAEMEGSRARELLAQYNAAAGVAFEEAAHPSPDTCRYCPCIPFCEAFWQAALPSWVELCGVHLEGHVDAVEESTVQGVKLVSLRIRVQRGTVAAGEAFVEQVPVVWATADGSSPPRERTVVRIVDARGMDEDVPPVIRVDRITTAVWTVGAEEGT